MRFPSLILLAALGGVAHAQSTPHPILFVTQVPVPVDFAAIGSTFANHIASPSSVYRGGDLWIRYSNGALRNLTGEAGFGSMGFQGTGAIAVRDPSVHWDGLKAVFSMVVGAPSEQFQTGNYRWQLYEVTGLGVGQTVSITPVPNQPTLYNNVMPAYLSDGRIVFASDRPRNGAPHLYPQHDEYESEETVTGLWRLDPVGGALDLLDHSPSGDFDPFVDSYGRVLFTRWDHLQRDQQADVPANGTFDWVSEAVDAAFAPNQTEVYPELRVVPPLSPVNPHSFNNFFPWEVGQDGTDVEFLNHLGRHEFLAFFDRSFNDDPDLFEFNPVNPGRTNQNPIENLFQMTEDPTQPGRYLGIDAPEFTSHASGQLLRLSVPPSANPDGVTIEYLTPRVTSTVQPDAEHTGHYRNPTVLENGTIVVAHTTQQEGVLNLGTPTQPIPNYRFRLKVMTSGDGGFLTAGTALTTGISKSVTWWTPDDPASYDGELWELSPVEVRARAAPAPKLEAPLQSPEQQAFAAAGVPEAALRQFLRDEQLGLIVVRNAADRDHADRQQPYNLKVTDGLERIANDGISYEIKYFQPIQGDQVRGIGGTGDPTPGRRVLARFLHDEAALANNLPNPTGPPGSAPIFPDGSTAMFVPARRALSWQTTAPDGTPVVRERFWVTVQPGEIRMCQSCHRINTKGQADQDLAANVPQALTALLQNWGESHIGPIFDDGFED